MKKPWIQLCVAFFACTMLFLNYPPEDYGEKFLCAVWLYLIIQCAVFFVVRSINNNTRRRL